MHHPLKTPGMRAQISIHLQLQNGPPEKAEHYPEVASMKDEKDGKASGTPEMLAMLRS